MNSIKPEKEFSIDNIWIDESGVDVGYVETAFVVPQSGRAGLQPRYSFQVVDFHFKNIVCVSVVGKIRPQGVNRHISDAWILCSEFTRCGTDGYCLEINVTISQCVE